MPEGIWHTKAIFLIVDVWGLYPGPVEFSKSALVVYQREFSVLKAPR